MPGLRVASSWCETAALSTAYDSVFGVSRPSGNFSWTIAMAHQKTCMHEDERRHRVSRNSFFSSPVGTDPLVLREFPAYTINEETLEPTMYGPQPLLVLVLPHIQVAAMASKNKQKSALNIVMVRVVAVHQPHTYRSCRLGCDDVRSGRRRRSAASCSCFPGVWEFLLSTERCATHTAGARVHDLKDIEAILDIFQAHGHYAVRASSRAEPEA